MARKALGRGLDALIPGRAPEQAAAPRLLELAVDQIHPNPQQPREHFDDSAIESIAASLKLHGVLQPLVVRKVEKGYELIAGERRWRAAQRAGLQSVPVVVRDATPTESLELALIENVQREDLNAIEEAHAYQLLTGEMGLTQEEAATRVGRDRSTVANYLRLLRLPRAVQQMIVSKQLTMGHARALLSVEDTAAQRRLAEAVIAQELSVRETERRARLVGQEAAPPKGKSSKEPDVAAAEDKLSSALGTRVHIKGKDRGRLEIRFNSLDELNRLFDLLLEIGR